MRRITRSAPVALWAMMLVVPVIAGCSSGRTTPHPSTSLGGGSTSTLETLPGPTSSLTPSSSSEASSGAWCRSAVLSAQAGSPTSVYGNGEAVDVTVTQNGQAACVIPGAVTVVLTASDGAPVATAHSSPPAAPTTLRPGGQARLRIDWVSQGCFAPSATAAGGRIEWSGPTGPDALVIQGIGRDSIAPCHSVFGVSGLQAA